MSRIVHDFFIDFGSNNIGNFVILLAACGFMIYSSKKGNSPRKRKDSDDKI